MNKKLKLGLLALLGFSTACSTVKNTSKSKDQEPKAAEEQPSVVVMYGVRTPEATGSDEMPGNTIEMPAAPQQQESPAEPAENTNN